MGARAWRRARGIFSRGGLTRRALSVSVFVSIIIGGAFAVLLLAINDLRGTTALAGASRQVLVSANQMERLVLDIETGERGFVLTGQESFLQPWYRARAKFPVTAAGFERVAASGDYGQGVRARQITRAIRSYIRDYSVPVVNAGRRDLASVRTVAVTEDGKRRVDAIREQFTQFGTFQRDVLAMREARAELDARRATVAAAVGVGGSMLLILASGGYLTRAVVRPIRGVSIMAGRLAGGDLTVRMPATGPAEIGRLERAFNTMAGSLEASRDELRRVAEEQAALRRVATLVARGVSPPEVFGAVAAEMGHILDAVCTAVGRYEGDGDGTVTVVGAWCDPATPGRVLPAGSRWPRYPESVPEQVERTGRPAHRATCATAGGAIATWARQQGIASSVASPVEVEGRLWGVVIAFRAGDGPVAEGVEERMLGFTELLATAIANAQSRAELAASRARVVAASDETRRRIERDLHDGTQQRLIALGLELRAAEQAVPAGQDRLGEQLSHTARGLADVVGELQELSRGLHPAILSQGGLGPALKALARRSAVPVELSVRTGRRLPERTEVAAYYVASEALTNVAKHAHASVVCIDVTVEGGVLRLSVRDDGAGGADPGRGSGLIGLRDRVEAIGGILQVISPRGGGTSLLADIPAGDG